MIVVAVVMVIDRVVVMVVVRVVVKVVDRIVVVYILTVCTAVARVYANLKFKLSLL